MLYNVSNPDAAEDGGTTVNHEKYFGPVVKRGGLWGWFEVTAATRVPRFVSFGYAKTKRDAAQARLDAIEKEKGRCSTM